MGTHSVKADLDVDGEVKGTSLDINGIANISSTLTLEGTTDQALILKSTDDGPIYHSYFRGSDRHAYVGFGGSSDSFQIVNEESAGTMIFQTASTTALSIDSSQNATFSGNIEMPSASRIRFGAGDALIQEGVAENYALEFQTYNGSSMTEALRLSGDNTAAFTGNVTIAGKASIPTRQLAKTSNTDADADGDVVYFGSTTSMDAGKIYHYNSSGAWVLADADAESTAKGLLGVALGSASNTNGVLIRGMVTLDHDPGTVGHTLFLHTTAGQATITAPSGNGDIVRVIGYLLDSTNGQIYFNPDGTFVEVTA